MSPVESPLEWDDLVAQIVDIGTVSADEISPGSRLVEDLDLDSLALAELLSWVITKYDLDRLEEFESQRWEGVTVRDLLDMVERSQSAPRT